MPRIKRADRADQSRGMHMSGIRHASQKPALNLSGLFFFYQDWNETFHVLLPFPLCPPSKISTFSLTSPAPSAHALSNYCQSASHDPHGIMGHEAAWWKGKPQLALYHYCQLLQPSRHHGYDVGHRCASSYRFKQLLLLLILLPTLFLLTLQYTLLPPSPTEIIKAPTRDPLLKFSLLKFLHFSWKLPALLKLLRELLMPLTPL